MNAVVKGKERVWLIVEDEPLVAMLVEDAIAELGLTASGPATRVDKALQLIEERNFDGAILDVNLAGEPVYPVATLLRERQIPFLFLTGYGEEAIRDDFDKMPIVKKPFTVEQIQTAIRRLSA
jgi:DNA-binding response OmpR family regulator